MKADGSLPSLSAIDLRDRLQSGTLSARELVIACADRIKAREPEVQAWAWFDAEAALREADRLDAHRQAGAPLGALHGLPIGVKDVIDTAGIPSENGCPVDTGRVPETDALVVQRLKEAGAIMLGKTVTTELAYLHPNKTRNPRHLEHTPGGSSSGSAAAVADGMVPLAIGTQTGGSVVRPASFCGVTGFKPTFNAIARKGVLTQCHSLDTVGVFANDPLGAALLAGVLSDVPADPLQSENGFLETALTERSDLPRLGFVQPPGWERADQALHSAFETLCGKLDTVVVEINLPDLFDDVAALRAVINTAEMGYYFKPYLERGADRLGPPTRAAIEEGLELPATDYLAAKARQDALPAALAPIFARCDAILCPAALGPAPEGLGSTGDSIFNGLWTMAGTPAITLPILSSPDGLPIGAQLVGPVGGDGPLLNVATWLWNWAKRENGDDAES